MLIAGSGMLVVGRMPSGPTIVKRARLRFEQFVEKLLHGFPRAVVGFFVVGSAFGIVRTRSPIGKGMDRAAVSDQLPVRARFAHFLFEPFNFFGRDKRVIRPVLSKDLAADFLGIAGIWRTQPSVKADD